MPEINYAHTQLSAGSHHERENVKIFYTNLKGKWWCGWQLTDLSTEQLLALARSIEADLLRLYPNLK